MDLSKLLGMFGAGEDEIENIMGDSQIQEMMQNPQVQAFMQNPNLTNIIGKAAEFAAQGGIMPDDVERMTQDMGGMDDLMDQMSGLFGGMGFDEIDLDEEVEAYEPEAVDAGDRAFVIELKAWLKDALTDITAADVCMLEIGYHLGYSEDNVPGGDLWLAYNTAQTDAENRANSLERWNFANWTDNRFRALDEEPLTEWLDSQGYDLEEDDDDLTQRIYDLAVLAVAELHREKFTEQRFGKKVPFIIEDFEYNQQTAIRAVKANGEKTLFDQDFYSACGFEDDEKA